MKFSNTSHEAVGELLQHLADNEEFQSLKKVADFSPADVRVILREIAAQLQEVGGEDVKGTAKPNYEKLKLSPKAVSLISCLSPREEILLFKSFHLL